MLLIFVALIACNATGEDTADGSGADATAGAQVFADTCAGCHGANGEGASGPAMSEAAAGKTEADVEDVVRNGSGDMPAQSQLSDPEMADVAAYVVETWGG